MLLFTEAFYIECISHERIHEFAINNVVNEAFVARDKTQRELLVLQLF